MFIHSFLKQLLVNQVGIFREGCKDILFNQVFLTGLLISFPQSKEAQIVVLRPELVKFWKDQTLCFFFILPDLCVFYGCLSWPPITIEKEFLNSGYKL